MRCLGIRQRLAAPGIGREPVSLDFEALLAHNREDITLVAPYFGGLDWTWPESPEKPNDPGHWDIVADGNPFAAASGAVWIQGYAFDIRSTDPDIVADFAKITQLDDHFFSFESMALRTRFIDNPGKDKNNDGIDDGWLHRIEIRFRDVNDMEVWHTVDFTEDTWVVVTVDDVPGLSGLDLLKSITFCGDAEKAVKNGDRFALDDVKIRLH